MTVLPWPQITAAAASLRTVGGAYVYVAAALEHDHHIFREERTMTEARDKALAVIEKQTDRKLYRRCRLEVVLSNGHPKTITSEWQNGRSGWWELSESFKRFATKQFALLNTQGAPFGVSVQTTLVFTDDKEVVTVERTFTKTELTSERIG